MFYKFFVLFYKIIMGMDKTYILILRETVRSNEFDGSHDEW